MQSSRAAAFDALARPDDTAMQTFSLDRRRLVLGLAALSALAGRVRAADAQERLRLQPFFAGFPDDGQFRIDSPGDYALDKDLAVREQWGAGHSGPNGGFVVNIFSGNVGLDFQDHKIDVHYGLGGVVLSADNNRDAARRAGASPHLADSRFVSLRGGTIDLAGGKRTGDGVVFKGAWHEPAGQYFAHGEAAGSAPRVPGNVDYIRNDYRFEDLKILARGLGLAAEGSHTVIRNCIIESAGNAGIFCAGPNVLIENCEIRLRALVEGPYTYQKPLRAAIVLRDASNAIVRNCRIRVDQGGLPSDTRCILVRDGATNVVVENNTFVNVDERDGVTTMEDAVVTRRGNQAVQRWL